MRLLILAGLALLLPGPCRGDEGGGGANMQVQVEWIQVPHPLLTALMAKPELVADGTKMRRRLQELVKKRKASVYDTAIVCTQPGRLGAVEAHRDWVYPSEAQGVRLPSQVDPAGGSGAGTTKPNPLLQHVMGTPAAFEFANVGSLLEVEAVPSADRKFMDLRISAQQSAVQGIVEHNKRITPSGNSDAFRTPQIEFLRTSVNLTVADGGYAVAGVVAPEGSPDERLIVMVRCDLLD